MGSYLPNHNVTFEPIEQWPGKRTKRPEPSQFSAKYWQTLALLDRELSQLRAKKVVLQCYLSRGKIRRDGLPRSDARMAFPGVIVSFESKHGPIAMPCDRFNDWQDNIRAIALALEALRKVDRYGVTQRAEQYRGWQPLPPPSAFEINTPSEARSFLSDLLGLNGHAEKLDDLGFVQECIRRAQAETHPDRGGDAEKFKRVMRCEEVLLGDR